MLNRSTLDRDGLRRHDADLVTALVAEPGTRVLAMQGERLPVTEVDGRLRLAFRSPSPQDSAEGARACYLGRVDGAAVVAIFAPPQPDSATHRSLRAIAARLDAADTGVAVLAVGMANWTATQGFCSRCGAPTESVDAGWVWRCTVEGIDFYPRTDSAVIMSVIDDQDRLLLAAGTRHVSSMMSVLAGFVEPGEPLEAAVRREVMEEVGVPVGRVTYVDNQPWPMPASLMVGFEARAEAPELTLDPSEISRARWFTRAELLAALTGGELTVPPTLSIARHLIERWYGAPLPDQPGDLA
ncbi:NAD(+) diphosphatase [Calidifontibacter sp. DB0510]|uniref:NAD(+) diphosphatase n=1 Tax=Metallococcus carri TaxID=1656884 RepID=A0A967B394_9MICO|nr:NAD(+) diphosphatase [Metallococcus carri]NHN56485.1 NAD(+) diphosphatase [Metallococcus carri]NOP36109.1 NAD(+) diphosphatase [Calidifontibacter sp. DB2511S]